MTFGRIQIHTPPAHCLLLMVNILCIQRSSLYILQLRGGDQLSDRPEAMHHPWQMGMVMELGLVQRPPKSC